MPNIIINELNSYDVANKSVMNLDLQTFAATPHLMWSAEIWLDCIEDSIVSLAIRFADKPVESMLGNIVIILESETDTEIVGLNTVSFRIYTLAIDKDYQRQGLAIKLLHQASEYLTWIQEYTKISMVSLRVEKYNLAAIKLYTKCGFSIDLTTNTSYEMSQSVNDFYNNMIRLVTPKPITRLRVSS